MCLKNISVYSRKAYNISRRALCTPYHRHHFGVEHKNKSIYPNNGISVNGTNSGDMVNAIFKRIILYYFQNHLVIRFPRPVHGFCILAIFLMRYRPVSQRSYFNNVFAPPQSFSALQS